MVVDSDVAAARGAVLALERAAVRLFARYGDTVDARRLRLDLARVREDVDLLCGSERTPSAPRLEVIDETPYSPGLWVGAEDEGVGSSRP